MTWARLAPLPKETPDYEHLEQSRFFSLLSQVNHPAAELTAAIPNGAIAKLRGFATRKRFFDEGAKGGIPDVVTFWPSSGFHGFLCEMKRPGEKPRKEQLLWHQRLRKAGFYVCVCFSASELFQEWLDYLQVEAQLS